MLETIFSWILSVVCELLDAVVTSFLGMMKLDLASISASFPALTTGYAIFQAIGLGLVILIGTVQLFKFFAGQLANVQDTPVRILVRSAIAAMLIWFGGHFVELAVDLARIPYDIFVAYDATATGISFVEMSENFGDMNLIDGVALTLGAPALLVLTLIVILLIGWNILKLMLEVCQRFLMIGVLAYSAPLIYPTLSSQATGDIFKRWVGMFAGQCAIMTISAWMLKVIVSGFSFQVTDTNILFRLVLTLAFCKIAQRTDTYMQQLGIGVATTGGNLIDEAIGLGMMFMGGHRRSTKAHHGDGDGPVLGADSNGSLSRFGGLFGGISNAAHRAAQQWKQGEPASVVGSSLGKNFLTGMGVAKGAETIKDAMKNRNLNTGQRAAKFAKGTAQVVGGFMAAGTPANAATRFQAQREEARRKAAQDAYQGASDFNQRSKDARYQPPQGEGPYRDPNGQGYDNSENMSEASEEVRTDQQAAMQTASQYFASQRASNGVGSFESRDSDGSVNLDETAQKAGLRLNQGTDSPMIEGRDDVVGDFLAKNYQAIAGSEDMQEFAVNTAMNGSPLAAEQALNNPYCTLESNDELGDALIKKAYGEEAITGKPGGGYFTNIQAENIGENGRVIHTDYVDSVGNVAHYDIRNAEALNEAPVAEKLRQFADGATQKESTVEGVGSGAKMYVHRDAIPGGMRTSPGPEFGGAGSSAHSTGTGQNRDGSFLDDKKRLYNQGVSQGKRNHWPNGVSRQKKQPFENDKDEF